jgi:hypothetical protein
MKLIIENWRKFLKKEMLDPQLGSFASFSNKEKKTRPNPYTDPSLPLPEDYFEMGKENPNLKKRIQTETTEALRQVRGMGDRNWRDTTPRQREIADIVGWAGGQIAGMGYNTDVYLGAEYGIESADSASKRLKIFSSQEAFLHNKGMKSIDWARAWVAHQTKLQKPLSDQKAKQWFDSIVNK